jgi:integrase
MATTRDRRAAENVLAAFDEHLRRTRGVCAGTRRNYRRYAHAFLETVFAGSPVDVAAIRAGDVAGFTGALARRHEPRTVELAASALRSFLRFLRGGTAWRPARGRGPDGAASSERSCPASSAGAPGAADRIAGFVLAARAAGPGDHLVHGPAGAAASEVTQLRLEDPDWRNATVWVRARKTGCHPPFTLRAWRRVSAMRPRTDRTRPAWSRDVTAGGAVSALPARSREFCDHQ